jgi:phosphate transport system substrate-binding protein
MSPLGLTGRWDNFSDRGGGRVMRWKQVNPAWPDRPIRLFGPGADSGTFDYFNKAVNGDPTNTRTDVVTSEDDNVLVDAVAQDPLALSYFGFEYLQGNRERLRPLALVQADGTAVMPSVEAVQKDAYRPLARPLFLYVNDEQLQRSPALRSFLEHTLSKGRRIAEKAGSIPLIDSTYRLTEAKVYKRVRGSAYDGRLPIGLTLGEVLNRSLDQDKKPEFRADPEAISMTRILSVTPPPSTPSSPRDPLQLASQQGSRSVTAGWQGA